MACSQAYLSLLLGLGGNWSSCPGGELAYSRYTPSGKRPEERLMGIIAKDASAARRRWKKPAVEDGPRELQSGTQVEGNQSLEQQEGEDNGTRKHL